MRIPKNGLRSGRFLTFKIVSPRRESILRILILTLVYVLAFLRSCLINWHNYLNTRHMKRTGSRCPWYIGRSNSFVHRSNTIAKRVISIVRSWSSVGRTLDLDREAQSCMWEIQVSSPCASPTISSWLGWCAVCGRGRTDARWRQWAGWTVTDYVAR